MAIETLGAALRQISHLFGGGTVTGLSDAQLLDRFLVDGDSAAFEALVERHGPMVLSVCRGVLRDFNDAEDAFQATFLILVKKARTIRGRQALGGWLYQVAHRVAIQANGAAARRRAREREAGEMIAASATSGPHVPDDLLPALHQEIARLPEKYRLPVVLCDLEGLPQAEVAGQLNWSERTLRRRLAEARDRLKARLARRGLALDGATLGAVFLGEARAAVPPAWNAAAVRAALHTINPSLAAGAASTAARSLTQEVLKTMSVRKLTMASATLLGAGVMAWAASAALAPRDNQPSKPAPAAARRTAPAPRPEADAEPPDAVGTFPARGRVLDPDGQPVAGAGVYVRHHAEIGWGVLDSMAARQKGRVASTDADGRFHFDLDKGASDVSFYGEIGWHKAQVAVAAPGFAPAWVEVGEMVKRGEMALRLVRDDLPVRGRVLDPQGRPVPGVAVRIRAIWEVNDGVDLDAMLTSGAVDEKTSQTARRYGVVLGSATPTWQGNPAPLWPGGRNAWTTGADGRFEVRGIGRDRIARLEFHGGGVADGTLDVMARPAKAPPRARPLPSMRREGGIKDREAAFLGLYPQGTPLVGATFDYIAGPTKPFVGVVRLKGSGKPVEGAIVRVADPATHTSVTARTDAAGRFRLDGVPKAEFYQIRVIPRQGIDPFLHRWQIMDDTEGLKPIEAAIEVPPGVIVTGRLIDKATGRAVPPAYVEYIKAPDNVATEGNSLGFSRLADAAFGLTVPPGRGIIAGSSSADGTYNPYVCARLKAADRGKGIDGHSYTNWLSGSHTYGLIDVPAGAGRVAVDLELTRGLSRAGRLTGPDGRPVVGAVAHGLSALWGMYQTLDADTFEVGGLEPGHPRQLVFTHQARKFGGALLLKDEDLKSTALLEVKLVPMGAVTGRLVDADGLPWARARLHVAINYPDHPHATDIVETTTADAQGRFRIDGVVPGVETDVLSIEAPNRPGALLDSGNALRKLVLKPGEIRDVGDVKAKERPQQ